MARPLSRSMAVAVALAVGLSMGCSESSRSPIETAATPAGYWEGKVSTTKTPMKDQARTMTLAVTADIWFAVTWDAAQGVGVAVGEADAVYDAVLKVENLPKVTAPVPGGSVKFEPEVGGKLSDTDNRRRYPIVGVLAIDAATGQGTLRLEKVESPPGTAAEKLDAEAKGTKGPDSPMAFTLRADPGISGGLSGAGGNVNYSGGRVSGGAGGAEVGADVGGGGGVIVEVYPMTPFSPFLETPGRVEKRAGGPYVASYEEKGDKLSSTWTVKQMGGEHREPPRITPDMQRRIDELIAAARRGR